MNTSYHTHISNYGSDGVTLVVLIRTPLSHYGYNRYGCLVDLGSAQS
jgi:hypothetical protein